MGWQIAWEPTLPSDQGFTGERNFRNVLPANTSSYNGSKIRITIAASAADASVVDGSSIGVMTTGEDMDGPENGLFKRITWVDAGGGNGITVPAGESKVSDEITFNFDKTKRHGIHFYYLSRLGTKYNSNSVTGCYFLASGPDQTMLQDATYSFGADYTYTITKLEVYVSGVLKKTIAESIGFKEKIQKTCKKTTAEAIGCKEKILRGSRVHSGGEDIVNIILSSIWETTSSVSTVWEDSKSLQKDE